ncbi:SoxR reducing system RseC family protein [Kangiella sp. TOML190]|uniref:SoxR reducing system RseC family protein n=1 Tax=Kangiella sp. TOML190 TaxID=2931351 RepID=UPI002041EECC|nr:SoxR reducing system RseC family protein [Kangiella sp. TOML190]
MLTETGQVVEIKGETAWVQTLGKTSCNSCQVNSSCGTGIISKAFGERSFITPMTNQLKARVGDQVEVGIPEDLVVKSSFLVYLLPLACMMLTAFLSRWLFAALAEPYVIAMALMGLLLGFYGVRLIGQKNSKNKRLEPVLLRIVKRPIAVKQIETSS